MGQKWGSIGVRQRRIRHLRVFQQPLHNFLITWLPGYLFELAKALRFQPSQFKFPLRQLLALGVLGRCLVRRAWDDCRLRFQDCYLLDRLCYFVLCFCLVICVGFRAHIRSINIWGVTWPIKPGWYLQLVDVWFRVCFGAKVERRLLRQSFLLFGYYGGAGRWHQVTESGGLIRWGFVVVRAAAWHWYIESHIL